MILSQLMKNENYLRKVSPFLKNEYFENKSDKILFEIISEYFTKFKSPISNSALKVEISKLTNLTESEYKNIITYVEEFSSEAINEEWLVASSEEWCKKRAVYNAILESIGIIEGKNKQLSDESIPKLLSDALAVTFDTSVGHDYIEDAHARYEFMHAEHSRIPFDIDILNKITKGGLIRKTLNGTIAESGAGKSAFMCHLATSAIKNGFNVLYLTMEMAEESVAERIDANLMKVNINDIPSMSEDVYMTKIDRIKSKSHGKLIIKEYPTSSAHVGHFRALIEELKIKKNFKADLVIVDYLNICCSSRVKMGASVNTYTYVKFIAEELRGLAVEQDVAMWTATQTNRGGYSNSDISMSDTSESMGFVHTLDLYLAQMAPEELVELNQMMFKQLKNRYNDPNHYKRFVVGFDRPKMVFYDVEESAQESIVTPSGTKQSRRKEEEDKPLFDKGKFGARLKESRDFNSFNFE